MGTPLFVTASGLAHWGCARSYSPAQRSLCPACSLPAAPRGPPAAGRLPVAACQCRRHTARALFVQALQQPVTTALEILLAGIFVFLHARHLGYADVGLSYERVRSPPVQRAVAAASFCCRQQRLQQLRQWRQLGGVPTRHALHPPALPRPCRW